MTMRAATVGMLDDMDDIGDFEKLLILESIKFLTGDYGGKLSKVCDEYISVSAWTQDQKKKFAKTILLMGYTDTWETTDEMVEEMNHSKFVDLGLVVQYLQYMLQP